MTHDEGASDPDEPPGARKKKGKDKAEEPEPTDSPSPERASEESAPAKTPSAESPPAKSPPAESPPAKSPSAKSPPAKAAPAESPPAKSPSAKSPPAELPPPKPMPVESPLAQSPTAPGPQLTANEDTEQYVLTIQKASGVIIKVERLTTTTGEREEFTEDDYAKIDAYYRGMIECAAYFKYGGLEELYATGMLDYAPYSRRTPY